MGQNYSFPKIPLYGSINNGRIHYTGELHGKNVKHITFGSTLNYVNVFFAKSTGNQLILKVQCSDDICIINTYKEGTNQHIIIKRKLNNSENHTGNIPWYSTLNCVSITFMTDL
jgi:hypothetical protein